MARRTILVALAVVAGGVLCVLATGCGGTAKPGRVLSVQEVESAFRTHHIPVANAGCGRIPLNAVRGTNWTPKYPTDPGSVCQLTWSWSTLPGASHGGFRFVQVDADVATDGQLLSQLLASSGSHTELLGDFGVEHVRIANVLVTERSASRGGRLPSRIEERVQAALVDLRRLAAAR